MIEDPDQCDFPLEFGIGSEAWRDQDPFLFIAGALKGPADKNPSETTQAFTFFSKRQYFVFYFVPIFEGVSNQAPVHGRHHDTVAVGFNNVSESGRNDYPAFLINGMK
jgi:hypothetical protein